MKTFLAMALCIALVVAVNLGAIAEAPKPAEEIGAKLGVDLSSLSDDDLSALKSEINQVLSARRDADSAQAAKDSVSSIAGQVEGLSCVITNSQERLYESHGETRWETLIEITNNGTEPVYLGVQHFDLTDDNYRILKTGSLSTFPDILYPGEKGCFYGNEELKDTPLNETVNFVPRWSVKKLKGDRVGFDLSDIEIRNGDYGTTVFGRMTNNTNEKQSWVEIVVILYAVDDTPIGVWMTNVFEDMPVGSKIGFEVSGIRSLYDKVTPEMVDHYVAYACPPQYQ